MRFIKLGLISIVFLSVVITGISFFFPSRVRISKAIAINADRERVMQQIGDEANWKNWYPGGDSMQAITIIQKTDSSVRAANVDNASKNNEMGLNIFSGEPGQPVTVQWYMDFHLHWYPWEKFSSLLLEKTYGPKMEKGLSDLKRVSELPGSH